MAHPSQYFIRYLLVMAEDLSLESINSTLNLYGMASTTVETFGEVKDGLGNPPEDFRPWDKAHRPSTRWLRSKKIYSLLHPDRATIDMREKILSSPRLREDVERLILGNVSVREASFRLGKLGKKVSDLAIAEYRHYFWNTDCMGVSDWADYIQNDDTDRTAVTSSSYNAALHAGPEVAMYRIGVRKLLDSKKIMLDVQSELYHTFLETRALPLSSKKVEMLSALSRGLARIDERVQAGDTALQDVLRKFEKFKVLTADSKPPTLFQLAPTGSVSDKSREEILMSDPAKKQQAS